MINRPSWRIAGFALTLVLIGLVLVALTEGWPSII